MDKGFGKDEPVDVVIRPEDVDIVAPENGMLQGTVTSVTFKGVHYEIIVDIDGFKWMIQTTEFSAVGDKIGICIKPEEIQVMRKSAYSGLYGDYSSFSEEFDELSDRIFFGRCCLSWRRCLWSCIMRLPTVTANLLLKISPRCPHTARHSGGQYGMRFWQPSFACCLPTRWHTSWRVPKRLSKEP